MVLSKAKVNFNKRKPKNTSYVIVASCKGKLSQKEPSGNQSRCLALAALMQNATITT